MLLLHVKPPPATLSGHLPMGTAPGGGRPVEVDSRVIRRDGRPWLPVMGEFHFSRYPAHLWRRELLMMRACGIDVIATYLFWNQHESERGTVRFDGSLDVRRFVELCAELDLAVAVRIGPWSHGECRNGGFPDWLADVDCVPRTDDPTYLALVEHYYAAIARRLSGLWWADGGPVVAVQVENELHDQPDHLATLRATAQRVGVSAPLWTATGWGAARIPPDVLLPLYGGYPEAFWEDASDGWAREVRRHYFPTPIRDDHAIGADLRPSAPTGSGPDDARYPYATCELGGGMAIAYHRRPLVPAADVSALALTKLASGSAWQGYYLFHGCSQRLDLPTPNQESHATGYPNDLPVVDYDFQAPLGQYGQVRPSFAALRQQHLFLRDCGARLAPMPLYLPDTTPAGLDDRSTLRWSVRAEDGSGFLFVNNHQPHEPLPDHTGVEFHVDLDGRRVAFPAVDVPRGAHFVWPIGYDLGGVRLEWATAQPAGRITRDGTTLAVFVTTAGIAPRFGFAEDVVVSGSDRDFTVTGPDGVTARVLVLDEADGARLQRLEPAGVEVFALCDDPLVVDGSSVWVDTTAEAVRVEFLPDRRVEVHEVPVTGHVPAVTATPGGGTAPPARVGGPRARASAPVDEDFAHAAVYRVEVPAGAFDGVEELLLELVYTGDVARAYVGGRLVADHFWYGPPWQIGLTRFAAGVLEHGLEIRVLPRSPGSAVYVDPSVRARFDAALDTAVVDDARLVAVRRVEVKSCGGEELTWHRTG